MGIDEIAATMLGELHDGIEGTGIRPALIGEIGTNHPPTETEWRVVRAAGRAGAESGAAVNVHLSWRGADGLDVVAALVEEGMPVDRVILSHMDENLDRGYHDAVAATGCVIEFDTFGSEYLYSTASRRAQPDRPRAAGGARPPDRDRRRRPDRDRLRHLDPGQPAAQRRLRLRAPLPRGSNRRSSGPAAPTPRPSQKIMVETPRRLLDRP